MGCKFCASTGIKFVRNLSSGEIVEQIIAVEQDTGYRISNVEKLLNENNIDHINSEIEEIKVCLHEINSRIKFLKKRQKPLIAALKVLEKRINNEW